MPTWAWILVVIGGVVFGGLLVYALGIVLFVQQISNYK